MGSLQKELGTRLDGAQLFVAFANKIPNVPWPLERALVGRSQTNCPKATGFTVRMAPALGAR